MTAAEDEFSIAVFTVAEEETAAFAVPAIENTFAIVGVTPAAEAIEFAASFSDQAALVAAILWDAGAVGKIRAFVIGAVLVYAITCDVYNKAADAVPPSSPTPPPSSASGAPTQSQASAGPQNPTYISPLVQPTGPCPPIPDALRP